MYARMYVLCMYIRMHREDLIKVICVHVCAYVCVYVYRKDLIKVKTQSSWPKPAAKLIKDTCIVSSEGKKLIRTNSERECVGTTQTRYV